LAEGVAASGWAQVRFEQGGTEEEVFQLPVTVTMTYADGSEEATVVPLTARTVEMRLPLRARLRSVDVNTDGAALARFERP
jgi:hypothetical protein